MVSEISDCNRKKMDGWHSLNIRLAGNSSSQVSQSRPL